MAPSGIDFQFEPLATVPGQIFPTALQSIAEEAESRDMNGATENKSAELHRYLLIYCDEQEDFFMSIGRCFDTFGNELYLSVAYGLA